MHKDCYNDFIYQLPIIDENIKRIKAANIILNTRGYASALDEHENYAEDSFYSVLKLYELLAGIETEIEENFIDFGEELVKRYTKVLNLKLQNAFNLMLDTDISERHFELIIPGINKDNFRSGIAKHALNKIVDIRTKAETRKIPKSLYWYEELVVFYIGILILIKDTIKAKTNILLPAKDEEEKSDIMDAENIDIEKFTSVPEMIIIAEFTGIWDGLEQKGYSKAEMGRIFSYFTGKDPANFDGLLTKRKYTSQNKDQDFSQFLRNNPYTPSAISKAMKISKQNKINIDLIRLDEIADEIEKNKTK